MFGRRNRADGENGQLANAGTGGTGGDPKSAPAASLPVETIRDRILADIGTRIDIQDIVRRPRNSYSQIIGSVAGEMMGEMGVQLGPLEQRTLVSQLMRDLSEVVQRQKPARSPAPVPKPAPQPETKSAADPLPDEETGLTNFTSGPASQKAGRSEPRAQGAVVEASKSSIDTAKSVVQPLLMERIEISVAGRMPRPELAAQVDELVTEISEETKIQLNRLEQRNVVTALLNDMVGHGPLEPLLADPKVTDILVNGPKQVYVERGGKLELSDVTFHDNDHLLNIATRIVTAVGRRVDESSPICDARLADGSRVNVIIPPLALDGPSISIRKFSEKKITLDIMEKQRNISPAMAQVLKIAGRSRLNIIVSGGTGSGKTTLLNAISQMVDRGERIVTIEDAAELQLQQPHVVRLETRPPNLEGTGEISIRDLVKNALRMRPDRIILGEVRGAEVVDMLQAMNTGHDGSLCTVHANNPREALTRLENMMGLAGINLPGKAVRTQITQAVDIIVQVSRMRDGVRRITHITEIVGIEDDIILTQDLFTFKFEGEGDDGRLKGTFKSTGIRPKFLTDAEYFGLDRQLLEAMSWDSVAS